MGSTAPGFRRSASGGGLANAVCAWEWPADFTEVPFTFTNTKDPVANVVLLCRQLNLDPETYIMVAHRASKSNSLEIYFLTVFERTQFPTAFDQAVAAAPEGSSLSEVFALSHPFSTLPNIGRPFRAVRQRTRREPAAVPAEMQIQISNF
ncbi:hypothetical protein Y032_0001g393 [Ancylostoma ceylanicum]|uniref:Uncharacterized protein n=1 Tax=Ancylostoma ceylanicum TaxID=53326 RepID=A0A016W5U9_9BILA|nr:hypothetical protein Y032_0001g393 [Ancylostoma ceylanicum]